MLHRGTAICLAAGLLTALALAQVEERKVVYIYVSNHPANSSENQIHAFKAHADGRLVAIPGSPFNFDETSLSASGNQLFAVNRAAPLISSFAIRPNGALEFQQATNYARPNPNGCGIAGWLFSDRTGAGLYAMDFRGDCANNIYQSFATNGPNGKLAFLGSVNGGAGSFAGVYLPATFLSNNLYAYEATNNGCMYFAVHGFRRQPDGLLAQANISITLPTPPPGFRTYIPTFAAADAAGHIAITLLRANPPGCTEDERVQIAAFTAEANGNLTTTNTYATMHTASITNVTDLKISPGGDLIAVGGTEGLQLFHFNGANLVTPYTGILTVDPITQMFWDRSHHLYAISQTADRLHVFTITTTEYHEAPGSPEPIQRPQFLAVHPLQ
jgi:hypothetical protein